MKAKYKVTAKPDHEWGVAYYIVKRFLFFFYTKAYRKETLEGSWYTLYQFKEDAEKVCELLNEGSK